LQLSLETAEAKLLKDVLERFLSDLRMEIADTENYELRQSLKQDEETLRHLITRLDQPSPANE
jgi:hypothetical protein